MDDPSCRGAFRWLAAAALLALSAILVACTTGASLALQLSPTAVELFRGGQVQVEVTVTRPANATGDLTLAVSGLPSGVTAQFVPSMLAGAAQSSTLTLEADTGATLGAATVTVTVSGGGLSASRELEVVVETLTVEGLVEGSLGEPISGATVVITGHGSTVTAADGSFSLEDVTVPYDITVLNAAQEWAHTFVGVTSASPELFPLTSLSAPPAVPTATITGDLDAVVAPDHQTQVCVQGTTVQVYGCTSVFEGNSQYTITINWIEGTDVEVRLRAVEVSTDALTSEPTAITGAAASAPFNVTEGGAIDVDLVMGGPVAPANFTAIVSPDFTPASYNSAAMTHLTGSFTIGVTGFGDDSATMGVFTPFFSNATYTVAAGATTASGGSSIEWRTGLAQGSSVEFEPPTPPTQVLPADMATGVDHGTAFTVDNPGGGALTYQITPFVAGPSYAITTLDTAVTIPDLSPHGLTLPAASNYNWSVFGIPGVQDMEQAVTGLGYLGAYVELAYALTRGGPAPSGDGTISLSDTRQFTTE